MYLVTIILIGLTLIILFDLIRYFFAKVLNVKKTNFDLMFIVIVIYFSSTIILSFISNEKLETHGIFAETKVFFWVRLLFMFSIVTDAYIYAKQKITESKSFIKISENIDGFVFVGVLLLGIVFLFRGIGSLLSDKVEPSIADISFERQLIFYYKTILIPLIYITVSTIKLLNAGKKFWSFFANLIVINYLIFIFCMIYLKLKYEDFYASTDIFEFIEVIRVHSYAMIILYLGFMISIYGKEVKIDLVRKLFNKIFLINVIAVLIIPICYKAIIMLSPLSPKLIDSIIIAIITVIITLSITAMSKYIAKKYNG